jgi:hypothetical protein
MNSPFCSVCGAEHSFLVREMPNTCEYLHLGTHVCLDCCRKCDCFEGCAEIQLRLDSVLRRKQGKNKDFLSFFSQI